MVEGLHSLTTYLFSGLPFSELADRMGEGLEAGFAILRDMTPETVQANGQWLQARSRPFGGCQPM